MKKIQTQPLFRDKEQPGLTKLGHYEIWMEYINPKMKGKFWTGTGDNHGKPRGVSPDGKGYHSRGEVKKLKTLKEAEDFLPKVYAAHHPNCWIPTIMWVEDEDD